MNKTYIYLYTNKINNKKYIGQTNNVERRKREHKSNAFNEKSVNYNAILHKAFRKYGYENFDFEILEEIENNDSNYIDEREQYWIDFYKTLITEFGYNILEGGRSNFSRTVFSKEQIQDIKIMIKNKTSYQTICDKYNISKTFISNINNGFFFKDDNEQYPLCSYRIDTDTYDLLIEDLEQSDLSFSQLSKKYNLAESTVKKFNYGTLRAGYYKGEYPIRKNTLQQRKAKKAIELLLNSNLSKKEILKEVGISEETLRRINLGLTNKQDNLIYPLR